MESDKAAMVDGGVCSGHSYQIWVDLQSCIVAFHSLGNQALLYQSAGHVIVCVREAGLES